MHLDIIYHIYIDVYSIYAIMPLCHERARTWTHGPMRRCNRMCNYSHLLLQCTVRCVPRAAHSPPARDNQTNQDHLIVSPISAPFGWVRNSNSLDACMACMSRITSATQFMSGVLHYNNLFGICVIYESNDFH